MLQKKMILSNVLSPNKLFLGSTWFFFFLWAISPFHAVYYPSTEALVFLLVNVLSLYVPIFLYSISYRTKLIDLSLTDKKIKNLNSLLMIVLFISFFGYVLRFIDKFISRGVSLEMNMSERLDMIEDTSGTSLGLIAAFLYPLSMSLFVLFRYIQHISAKPTSKLTKFFVYFLFFLPALDAALLGKRGALMTLTTVLVLTGFWFSENTAKEKRKKLYKLFLISFLVLFLFIMLLSLRIESSGGSSIYWLLEIGRVTDLVKPSPEILSWTKSLSGFMHNTTAGLLGIWAYLIHGVYEFCYQFDHFQGSNAQWGGYTFWIIKKFFAMLGFGSFDLEKISNIPPRTFVYTTLLGPLYIDFHLYSPFFNLLLGSIICFCHRKAVSNILYLPLYIQLAIVIIFYPVVNMLTMFQGLYNLVAAVLFLCIGGIFLKR